MAERPDNEDEIVRLLVGQRSAIIAYALSIVFDRDLAEDVYQNVVLVVLRKRGDFDDVRDMQKWVFGVARVEALVALRKKGRAPQAMEGRVLDALDATWMERLDSGASSTDVADALRRCLDKLSDKHRRILRMRYVAGLSGERLAAQLGVKLNSAYVTLSRIHGRLRECVSRRLQEA